MHKCPICLVCFDTLGTVDGVERKPSIGDITICLNCTSILEFDKNIELKLMSNEDLASVDLETKNIIRKNRIKISEKNIKNM